MKRRALVSGILVLTAVACAPGEPPGEKAAPPSTSQATAGQPATTTGAPAEGAPIVVIDGDPPHFQNTIVMTANGGVLASPGGSLLTAECIGTVTMYRMVGVKRKHKIRWHIQNDPFNGCPGLQVSQVQLRFGNAIMANGVGAGDSPLDTLAPNGSQTYIQGRVHANPSRAPNNPHAKYLVFYKNLQASPDPELDINGDCGSCGPGGGS